MKRRHFLGALGTVIGTAALDPARLLTPVTEPPSHTLEGSEEVNINQVWIRHGDGSVRTKIWHTDSGQILLIV